MQKYYEILDKPFQQGQIQDAEKQGNFLAKLRFKIKKLCVVKIYVDIEEAVVTTLEIERVSGELRETSYEPMKE